MSILADVLASPLALALLTIVLVVLLATQRTLSWAEYRVLHRAKLSLFPRLDAHTALVLISAKGGRDDPEYIATREGTVREVFAQLCAHGGSPHVLCSLKRRPLLDGGTQLSAAHVVWSHADGSQTEAYLFDEPESSTVDVYAHFETSVADPDGHLTDPQTDGDPRGVVRMALALPIE